MSNRLVFRAGQIFDGTGAPPTIADITIQDGRIVEIGTELDGDDEVDAQGHALLPGLFDCHVHLTVDHVNLLRAMETPFSYRFYVAAANLARLLKIGITTVRDAGGADLGIKQAVDDGLIPGPRLRIALAMLSQTGGHGDRWMPSGSWFGAFAAHPGVPGNIVDGPDEMQRKVRELVRAGADHIKVCATGGVMSPRTDPRQAYFRPDELAMAVREAQAAGRYVMAHAIGAAGVKNAVRAGVRSIEHGYYLDDEAIELMLEHGTYLVPTLMAPLSVLQGSTDSVAISDASMEKCRAVVEAQVESFRRATAAGVTIAMGTDAIAIPHGRNLEELALMTTHGLPAAQALQAATSNAARLLGVDDHLGTLEPGKRADIVMLSGDALDVHDMASRVVAVFKDGSNVHEQAAGS